MSRVAGMIESYMSGRCAGYLAVAIAVALPWSTSATAALIGLWFLAYLPVFNFGAISREVFTWRGGLPLLLCAWAALGLLWSDASWTDSVNALRQYQKLIFIPLALAYFRHSDYGIAVVIGFATSCTVLLLVSLIVTVWPDVQWWYSRTPGVPVKTYITQSAVFAICAFCLLYVSVDAWKKKSRGFAIITLLIALAFVGDILFIITSRTELVVISVLVISVQHAFPWMEGIVAGPADACSLDHFCMEYIWLPARPNTGNQAGSSNIFV